MSKANEKVYFDRAAILAIPDLQIEDLWIPEWKTWVRVRGLNGSERDAYESSVTQQRKGNTQVILQDARAKLVALAVVDDAGQRMFTNADVTALGTKNAAAIDRIFDVASRLAGISDEDMEELAGNSESDQSGGSLSA